MWDLPGPGLEPVSPALAGVFLTTASPGKSLFMLFFSNFFLNFIPFVNFRGFPGPDWNGYNCILSFFIHSCLCIGFFQVGFLWLGQKKIHFFFSDISSRSPHPNDLSPIYIPCPLLELIHPWCVDVPIDLYASTRILLLSYVLWFVVTSWQVFLLLLHASRHLVVFTFYVQCLVKRLAIVGTQ